MKASENALKLIRTFEGLRLESYQDSVGKWTIGYGHTANAAPGKTITQSEADMFLQWDVQDVETQLNRLNLNLNQNQFDALVSWVFNFGYGNLKVSTLLKVISQNPNDPAVKSEWLRWCKAGGKELPGLKRRREAEYELYNS